MALQRLYHGNSPKNRFFAANAVASAALCPIQELLCQNCLPALACLPVGAAMPTFIQEQAPRLLQQCMIPTWRLETMSGHGVQGRRVSRHGGTTRYPGTVSRGNPPRINSGWSQRRSLEVAFQRVRKRRNTTSSTGSCSELGPGNPGMRRCEASLYCEDMLRALLIISLIMQKSLPARFCRWAASGSVHMRRSTFG